VPQIRKKTLFQEHKISMRAYSKAQNVHRRMGKPEAINVITKSERRLKNALKQLAKSRNLPGLYCQVGRLLGDLTKWKEAETAYRKALELSPTLDLAALGLATSLLHQNEHQKALAQLEAFADKSENALIYFFRGDAVEHLGRYDEAIKAFRESISLDPESRWGTLSRRRLSAAPPVVLVPTTARTILFLAESVLRLQKRDFSLQQKLRPMG
jgi:tetratricopeptide (TPR) repeat protein